MAETKDKAQPQAAAPQEAPQPLEGGTYEIIRNRLSGHGRELRQRLEQLNAARKDVFGGVESRLVGSERITTANNCVPRDMIPVGQRFLFGYNVFIGLRSETVPSDVLAVYEWRDGALAPAALDLIRDERFETDFRNLYKYYRQTTFAKFALRGPHLFMVFRVGKSVTDVKAFKWLVRGGQMTYLDNRSDHEFTYPPQHEFEWKRATHDMQRSGQFPHVSIEDRVFVETVGGDLTVKIEDNTTSGEGIYREPVDNPDQTLDDAEIHYALVGNLVLLRIRPYQEQAFRYIVYNEKVQQAVRIDSIADACVLLPDGHGLIFPKGVYLQVGQVKLFDHAMEDMVYEKCIPSPNGEDFLYCFYNRESGGYVLLSYNLIEQRVDTPIVCSGFSCFADGTLTYFRAEEQPQKHHAIQVWQTPYRDADHPVEVRQDSFLYKIGNKDIVRCMAECTELLTLLGKDDTYGNLYVDIAKAAQDIRDSYFWVGREETFRLAEPLEQIRQAAASAIEEYEKVVRTRRGTREATARTADRVRQIIGSIDYDSLDTIGDFVRLLAELRAVRGEVVSLRELRYADGGVIEGLEAEVSAHTGRLSGRCVEFLLQEQALAPYRQRVQEQAGQVPKLAKVADGRQLEEDVAATAAELEMLIEIVSNLRIEDPTQTTAIIDGISLVYSKLNQVRSALKNRIQELASSEGRAEFASQIKLIDQAAANYLDVCDTPDKADEYLTRLMVQLEALESRFADFDEFIVELATKREELYNAFESRKVQLTEQRNRRATALMTAAERILRGIQNRAASLGSVNEINGYFASDLMIERLRQAIEQLEALGDSVKAEDIRSRLKTVQQDAVRQLKDRQALYEDGENVIRLGKHRFSVNHQPLELTIVQRDDRMFFHLAGTGFFDPVRDERLLASRDVWGLEVLSESPRVYRAEYLAHRLFQEALADGDEAVAELAEQAPDALLPRVQAFMGPRYAEGYVKGVHDQDAARILHALARLNASIGLLRYPTRARALATAFWRLWADGTGRDLLATRLAAIGRMQRLFEGNGQERAVRQTYVAELRTLLEAFAQQTRLFEPDLAEDAAEYLFWELAGERGGATPFVLAGRAAELRRDFTSHLASSGAAETMESALRALAHEPASSLRLLRDWVGAYIADGAAAADEPYADEVACALLPAEAGAADRPVVEAVTVVELEGLVGAHPRLEQGRCRLDYCDFIARLRHHERQVAPAFEAYQRLKKDLIERFAAELRLDEFRPRVMTTFVRNRLIDQVYLPLIGDNLAKQIGAAGAQKRTDRQGLLLLISPPGYGKTTLMEYVANRLGLIFMKVNGPAIGHRVTSLDPAEAPNAAAREEIEKLNLAFEMGDNVMIYLDDIQHCNAELLQKFISLCDAQRRIEGVYNGRTRTYDLRGKRVCVVMAGNPYTESGEKFRIPDMLANRADTYNIGDIVGDSYDAFVLSYLENCLTGSPVLGSLATRSQADVYAVIRLAETGSREGIEFEGNYTADELNEYVSTMKKLFVVRDVVLKVNQQYIRSAGQAEAYRTEPPFLLQGSYRNMNRIAARVLPVMNDDELWTLITSAYDQDAQTLTTGAEANLLKFKELVGRLTEAEAKRWDEIRKTFNRNKLLGGQTDDQVGLIIRQLNAFGTGLESIQETLAGGIQALGEARTAPAARDDGGGPAASQLAEALGGQVGRLGESMDAIRAVLAEGLKSMRPPRKSAKDPSAAVAEQVLDRMNEIIAALKARGQEPAADEAQRATEAGQSAQMLVSVLEEQFRTMQTWLTPVLRSEQGRATYVDQLIGRFEQMVAGYTRLIEVLRESHPQAEPPRP